MSERLMPNSKGLTRARSTVFDSAPASKLIQGACTLPRVTQRIPKEEASSSLAMSLLHRAPLSISSDDTYGVTDWINIGNQSRSTTAARWLRPPDQLRKTFTEHL